MAAQNLKPQRLDIALVDRGLVATRSRARDLITRGFVAVSGQTIIKPAANVSREAVIELHGNTPCYVSRGAEKLVAALDHFALSSKGRYALDVGASTGGFTEVLLTRGANRVTAVDVGRGQLNQQLRNHPDVIAMEATDARDLTPAMFGEPVNAITIDVSFISLHHILDPVLALATPACWLVALIKPQFEVGQARVGKNGIVTDAAWRTESVTRIRRHLEDMPDWSVIGVIESPILGGTGNQEYLIAAVHDG